MTVLGHNRQGRNGPQKIGGSEDFSLTRNRKDTEHLGNRGTRDTPHFSAKNLWRPIFEDRSILDGRSQWRLRVRDRESSLTWPMQERFDWPCNVRVAYRLPA
jgi:hypothetical protein